MSNQYAAKPNYGDNKIQVQAELLELLLEEEACYPWDPTTPESEAYLSKLEQEFTLLESLDTEEVQASTEVFFTHLHNCLTSLPNDTLLASLTEKFGQLVPQSWLEEIARGTKQVLAENLSHTQKLVQTVQPLLSNWVEEDIEVFARPFAYATRGNSNTEFEVALNQDAGEDWNNISPVKQARYTVMIAHYALRKLQAEE